MLGPGIFKATLPADLQKLGAATVLHLEGAGFHGTLPSAWAGFGALQELYLGDNHLSGSLPSEWGSKSRFQSLTTLTLYSNKLTGGLPGSWGSSGAFPKLRTLTLSNNDISGELRPACYHLCMVHAGRGELKLRHGYRQPHEGPCLPWTELCSLLDRLSSPALGLAARSNPIPCFHLAQHKLQPLPSALNPVASPSPPSRLETALRDPSCAAPPAPRTALSHARSRRPNLQEQRVNMFTVNPKP